MNKILLAGVLFFAAGLSAGEVNAPRALVVRDVTVIDCTGRGPQTGVSVLISEGRIQSIRPASELKIPANAEVLDAEGKYLIPGLWNMHTHLGSYDSGRQALQEDLAQGITGIRDMGSPLEDVLRLRRETEDGTIPGPHLVVAGPIVQGPLPFQMPAFISVKNTIEARQTVRILKSKGVDFIKVQDAIPHDLYLAIAKEARNNHISFAGHIPPTVLPEEAAAVGQRSMEHFGGRFWGLLIGSSKREPEFHAQEVRMYYDTLSALERKSPPRSENMRSAFTRAVVESYDEQRAAALISLLKKRGVWQCPTLVALRTLWNESDTPYSQDDLRWARLLIAREIGLVVLMQKAGVGLLAGTDLAPAAEGGTIHDELAALVDAGLTPLEALQTATRNPSQFLGKSASFGTIETGKAADLVLLNANPLNDIRNSRRVAAVILRGRVVVHDASRRSSAR